MIQEVDFCYTSLMRTLLLIDGHALLYRFYHALPPLSAPDGSPIQAIYGVANVLIKLLSNEPPHFIAAALDRPEETFRKKEFSGYKAHRPPASGDLIEQLMRLRGLFEIFSIPTLDKAGFEADDILGTLVQTFKNNPDLRIELLSGDLDLLQLVENDTVSVRIIKNGLESSTLYTEAKVFERYNLCPKELPDYKGLVGDASDNIPGVSGIGPKQATELLKEFKTIEGIYENLMIIRKQTAKKLEGEEKVALLSRKLATIKIDVPLEKFDLKNLETPKIMPAKLIPYFTDLGFSSLVERLYEF